MKVEKAVNKEDLKEVFKIREEVFIKEQGVPKELELDEDDDRAIHFIIKSPEDFIGTCRLLVNNNIAKVQRMAIKSRYRGKGLGSELLAKIIDFAKEEGIKELVLHAQKHAVEFYLKNGFNIASEDIIEEAGIEHLKMNKIL